MQMPQGNFETYFLGWSGPGCRLRFICAPAEEASVAQSPICQRRESDMNRYCTVLYLEVRPRNGALSLLCPAPPRAAPLWVVTVVTLLRACPPMVTWWCVGGGG